MNGFVSAPINDGDIVLRTQPSIADPTLVVRMIIFRDGGTAMLSGTRWQRFLIKLLSRSILRLERKLKA